MPPEDAIPRAPPWMDSNRGGGPTHLVPVETCGPVGLAHSISNKQCITISSCMTQLFSVLADVHSNLITLCADCHSTIHDRGHSAIVEP